MRYFYKDALEAAWMAEKYGMSFILNQDGADFDMPNAHSICHEYMEGKLDGAKFDLNNASVKMLEPQTGDLYLVKDDSLAFPLDETLCKKWEARPEGQIIQRGGIAFHWPECEH